ncbi:APC family permease [Loigolactobacillus bifermentans]|nr:APC family permease [Loigolactobacillus bifermentans]QGG61175.1 amino acid permease [Loigolactobacillus bifermentans]
MKKGTGTLSFNSVLLLGINSIIGSGIFLLPSTLFKAAGWASLVAIGLAGLATLMIAMNYAVMASKIDTDGGAWVYTSQAFGLHAGFQIGWLSWFLGVITISTEIVAFLTTLGGFWPQVHQRWVYATLALGLLGGILLLNYFGPSTMKVIDNLASATKIGLILLFLIAGSLFLGRQGLAVITPISQLGQHDFSQAFTTAFYMFTGFSFLPVAAQQIRHAEKVLPKALLVVMLVVTLLYLLTQWLTILLLGAAISAEKLPVAAALMQVLGVAGRGLMLAGMLVSTLGVAIAVSFDTPVGLASLATEKKLLPREFGRQNRFGAPVVALSATIGLAAILVLSGSYLFLVNLIILSAFVQYLATVFALLKLQHDPTLPAGIQLWGGRTLPILSLVLLAYLVCQFNWVTYVIGLGFVGLGELVYWLDQRRR